MYAIIELGGRQWKVESGTRLDINRISTAVGAQVPVERVLFGYDGSQPYIGRPYIQGARVTCEVIEHRLGPKEISYHFRRRENWRKTVGHRQPLTRLIVKEIVLSGAAPATASVKHETKRASTPKARASVTAKKKESRPKTTRTSQQ